MKRRISSDLRSARFLFVAVGLGMLYALINSIKEKNFQTEEILVLLILLLVCGVLFYVFDKAKTVEFDNDFMYVTSKTEVETIPLKDIHKIKLTMTQINKRNMWKIGYYDKDGTEKSIKILPRWINQHFDEFKECVKIANEEVRIKNWSHSFDLDQ